MYRTAISLALALAPGTALAYTGHSGNFYGTLGYGRLDDGRFEYGEATGRLGAQLTPYLGLEGEASFGIKSDKPQVSVGGDLRVKMARDAAVYGVGRLPLGDHVSLLARIGYGTTRIKVASVEAPSHRDKESLNYGLGAQFDFDGHNGLRADWTHRAFDGPDGDVYAISYVRRF
jgi:outer membrane immunogenic protein